MQLPVFLCILFLLLGPGKGDLSGKSEPMAKVVEKALDFSLQQALRMAVSLRDRPGLLPRSTDRFGKLQPCPPDWWTSGFFPGTLWYLYEYSGNEKARKWAHEYSLRVADQQFNQTTHDVGFIINCSFGNGFRITRDAAYEKVIRTAALSLISRYQPAIGCIRSWDPAAWNRQWACPVIIDNMMNLEILLLAAKLFAEPRFYDAAVAHANATMKHHYRPDFSCFHVVSFDLATGLPELKQTAQGYGDGSAWARGQAWGLYGFVMMYRFTKDAAYLEQAKNIARFLIRHPRLPADKIPYWDFDAPGIPNCLRDASAGAIICSALVELSRYVEGELAGEYLAVAETQIRTLSSPRYRNSPGSNGNFILRHSVGNMPGDSEVDVPLPYADYYYVEALMRYKKITGR